MIATAACVVFCEADDRSDTNKTAREESCFDGAAGACVGLHAID